MSVPGRGRGVSPLLYHANRRSPPSPSGFCGLSFGPATKPSSDIVISRLTLLMQVFLYTDAQKTWNRPLRCDLAGGEMNDSQHGWINGQRITKVSPAAGQRTARAH